MRVLFISDVYFPRVNGVSTSIRTFRADLMTLGVESTLVAPEYDHSAEEPDVNVIRVASGRVPGDPEDRRMKSAAVGRALAPLASQNFDLVHIHTPFIAHYAGVRFARRRGIPVIATYHTFFEEYLHHYVPLLPRPIGRVLARSFTRSQCAQVAAIIAPSEPMRALLLEYGVKSRVEVIPTGLPADRYVQGDGNRFRETYRIPKDRPLLLYVGRVAHEKNIDFLLLAFTELRRTRPETMFAIAGEGPALSHLQAQVARQGLSAHVFFIGYLAREGELANCYAAADVFVFASRTETQGLVLLEALAQGRPVVSTAHLGTRSILQAGCGARVAPERPEAFARAIADVLEDPVRAERLSEQAHSYAQTWASSRMAARLSTLYHDLIKSATAPAIAAA
ncbi:MAG TPA: glycosyltransferase [Steroidobacteraceae bacterium]|jgi:1,2-diacylglycerol 3-alpha-glucosyltransferase|nr:glycosyltransferase [Steroidobacteraceae bacterium]